MASSAEALSGAPTSWPKAPYAGTPRAPATSSSNESAVARTTRTNTGSDNSACCDATHWSSGVGPKTRRAAAFHPRPTAKPKPGNEKRCAPSAPAMNPPPTFQSPSIQRSAHP